MGTIGSSYKSSAPGYLVRLWIGGCVALGIIAAVCFYFQLNLATTGFSLLIAIVLLSLLDSFVSSAIFSIVGASLLNVLFTPPIFSFRIQKLQDYFPLMAFFVTSLAITSLVRRSRRMEQTQRAQARLLDLTHDTVFVRDKDEVIAYWNHAAEVLYGWSKAEATGKLAHELLKTVFPAPREEIGQMLLQEGIGRVNWSTPNATAPRSPWLAGGPCSTMKMARRSQRSKRTMTSRSASAPRSCCVKARRNILLKRKS